MHFPMPTPGLPGTPYFKGANITDFLETFIELYKDYNIKQNNLKTKVIKYCNTT
jgi:hypothetical protein